MYPPGLTYSWRGFGSFRPRRAAPKDLEARRKDLEACRKDLEARRTGDIEGRRQRTSRDGAVGPGRGASVGHPATPFKRTSETFFFAQQSLQFLS